MTEYRRFLGLAAVVLLFAFSASAGMKYEETVDKSFPLAPGGSVSLDNVNGDVTIEVWESAEVRVYAVKRASSQELLDRLEVEIEASSKSVRIDTKYPNNRRNRDHEDGDHDDHGYRGSSQVEYTLTIPRTAIVDGVDLVNGNLLIDGAEAGVDAEAVNGNIVVRNGSGSFDIETVNGNIEVYASRLGSEDEVNLESVNGKIDLYLAASSAAEIRAESLNGRLENDFGIAVHKGKYVGADFKGSVGGGGSEIDLETVNGAISVHSW